MKDGAQLALDLTAPPPRRRRTGALRSYHLRGHMTAEEAAAGEARAAGQDARVLRLFGEAKNDADEEDPEAGQRLTPSQVLVAWGIVYGGPAPLLTSIRRSLTNLTRRGLLRHHPEDRRPGPHGAKESVWSLAG